MARGPEVKQVDATHARLLYQGHTLREAAALLNVSTTTLWRRLKAARVAMRKPGHRPPSGEP